MFRSKNTGDMVLLEGPEIEIPEKIENKTHTADDVKAMLNRLSGLSALGFDPESTSGFKGRPSFRYLVAFNFHPQNVVRSDEHTSELQSLMSSSYAVFC